MLSAVQIEQVQRAVGTDLRGRRRLHADMAASVVHTAEVGISRARSAPLVRSDGTAAPWSYLDGELGTPLLRRNGNPADLDGRTDGRAGPRPLGLLSAAEEPLYWS